MNGIETTVVRLPEERLTLTEAFLRGLQSERTRVEYRRAVQLFEGFLGDRGLLAATRRNVEAWRHSMELDGLAPSTINKRMSAVSGWYTFAMDERAIDRNPAARARRPKKVTRSVRTALTSSEVAALLRVCDVEALVGLRDRALLMLLAVQGLRLQEVLHLAVGDLDERGGHHVALVHGKGSKIGQVPLAAVTRDAIARWREAAALETGPLMLPVLRGLGVQRGSAMSPRAALKRVRLLGERAGINRRVHPHLLRHSAVTIALESGVPLHHVQSFARHQDPRTTQGYNSNLRALNNPTAHAVGDPSAKHGGRRIASR